ncbi:type I restriction endonuclease [Prolixibacter sp. SD074]|uniref:type I restriction endonuclease n=1 Tax=Prolixibacter sp. SD074 TaxID=2652391 RepID=UPI001E386637|nr:type I restriction endonuclease [Prolixibacter sp. SD074]
MTENTIEEFTIKLLEHLGYQYIYAPNIAHGLPAYAGQAGGETPERTSYEEVLLLDRLRESIRRINPTIPPEIQDEAVKELNRIHSPELITNNEQFHRMLTEGIKVTYQKDGNERGDLVWLIDFNTPENNEFIVANQFTVVEVVEDGINKRPDVVLFVNGIPLVVLELKNADDEKATIKTAFNQIQTYKSTIPTLFTHNAFTIISDGLEAKAGTISAGMSRFISWKSADGKEEASNLVSQLETLITGMLNKETLLDLIRHFVVFENLTCLRATHRQMEQVLQTPMKKLKQRYAR